MSERGGRIKRVDADEILVLDLAHWSDAQTHALVCKHAMLAISIEMCTESLSGFAVRMKLGDSSSMRVFSLTVAILGAATAIVAFCMESA